MGTKLFLLFSHSLGEEQKEDARRRFGVEQFVPLPESLQKAWSNVPPDLPELKDFQLPIRNWLFQHATAGDYVLAQGDFGMVYHAVQDAWNLGLIPVYATTSRESKETIQADGSVRTQRIFKHVQFRIYGK
ncbi:CRISPR-associated protein Csx20 [Pontibacter sp. G13]|uniref:CRISPR-associated protein Csx20 n=1 Tax=Pontibacter sp. G13 TaxID=3074898 RepID=UPI00288BF8DA|nr:CRISPR-associated protein Csx20 [Pontibacter sp. G13]WNJ18629.1 CRISPR-associated protein Csx20 [Pontibacter sp. G13]